MLLVLFAVVGCPSVSDFVSVRRRTTIKRQRGDSLKEFRSASKKHDIVEAVEEESCYMLIHDG